jgi:hypothetical protein
LHAYLQGWAARAARARAEKGPSAGLKTLFYQ